MYAERGMFLMFLFFIPLAKTKTNLLGMRDEQRSVFLCVKHAHCHVVSCRIKSNDFKPYTLLQHTSFSFL